MKTSRTPPLSRRNFLVATAATSVFTLLPRHVLGGPGNKSPNEKLNIAGIGIGGMGQNNLAACSDENIIALCDVDTSERAGKIFAKYPKARQFKDFRVMLDQQKDIDAVIIATPDHTHTVIGLAAMERGKHVYIQKPLAHSIKEARLLTEAARKHKVATQMGNQGHSGDGTRLICEWIWGGVIGDVREVHAWTNRPVWPQSIEVTRPKETPAVPPTLDWDLWIGPAPYRPYHPTYHPEMWRAWWDFGTGSLGDLGCHVMDQPFWALKLKYPVSAEACISTYWESLWRRTEPKNEMFPRSTIIRYKFPAREGMPELQFTWWDGGLMPPRPQELGPGGHMDDDGGVLFIGDKGKIMCSTYGRNPTLLPTSKMKDFKPPAPTIERIPGGENGHEKDWVRACKGGKPASSNFDYSGPLSETVLMGNLAVRFPNEQLLWDGEAIQVTNNTEANNFVMRPYRQGWTI
jgi:predicted dehydrogenase